MNYDYKCSDIINGEFCDGDIIYSHRGTTDPLANRYWDEYICNQCHRVYTFEHRLYDDKLIQVRGEDRDVPGGSNRCYSR